MSNVTKNNYKNTPVANRLHNANKKTVVAIVLISIMAILWGRVLLKGKGGPATASAQEPLPVEQVTMPTDKPAVFHAVELAQIKGRHDVLSGDMFSTDLWKETVVEEKPVEEPLPDDSLEKKHQADLEKISNSFKLEAIIRDAEGKPFQVFVNDKILTVGSVLTVKEGPEEYELVLKGINENEATFIWNETLITMKMTEMVNK